MGTVCGVQKPRNSSQFPPSEGVLAAACWGGGNSLSYPSEEGQGGIDISSQCGVCLYCTLFNNVTQLPKLRNITQHLIIHISTHAHKILDTENEMK
jgi:hypothetical protein